MIYIKRLYNMLSLLAWGMKGGSQKFSGSNKYYWLGLIQSRIQTIYISTLYSTLILHNICWDKYNLQYKAYVKNTLHGTFFLYIMLHSATWGMVGDQILILGTTINIGWVCQGEKSDHHEKNDWRVLHFGGQKPPLKAYRVNQWLGFVQCQYYILYINKIIQFDSNYILSLWCINISRLPLLLHFRVRCLLTSNTLMSLVWRYVSSINMFLIINSMAK